MPPRSTFYSYFWESFSGEYSMYQFNPLDLCEYLCEISLKVDLGTDEGNVRNEMETLNEEMKLE